MLTLSWRRAGATAALAMALVAGLPALAQAQLFPNMWIQRERNPCANEPPFYAHIRHNYYGYFPTCWRKFPDGWACPCPNPEMPDWQRALQDRPRDKRPEDLPPPEGLDGTFPGPGGGDLAPGALPGSGRRPGDPADLPPLPRDPDGPMDINPGRPPGNAPAAPGSTVPGRGNQPAPFDPFAPQPPNLPRSGGPNSSSLRTPGPSGDGPPLDQPAGATSSAEIPVGNDTLAGEGAPVLALPEMSRSDGSLADAAPMPSSIPPDATTLPPQATAAPAQAPRRPGLLSGLFNWRRR